MPPYRWAILTGEYPPQSGGVSDYTYQLAHALVAAGDEVHIWAPAVGSPLSLSPSPGTPGEGRGEDLLRGGPHSCPLPAYRERGKTAGVHVHRLPDYFGLRSLRVLSRELSCVKPTRILVQYVPDAFGMGAMNVPFCLWLLCCAPGPVWTMFHEVAYPWVVGPSKLNVLAAATRAMGCVLLAASERAFVSIPAWARLLRPYNLARRPVDWLPVPSNLPINIKPAEAATVRKRVSPSGGVIIGHFGSFALSVVSMLRKFLPELLRRDARRIGLLVGRGGEIFRDSLLNEHPNLAGRIHAPGALPAESAACHLAACDLLVQPYPDGASCRRSSLMAGVALGIPIVTTSGRLTEPLWEASGAVALSDAAGMVRRAEELLADEHKRAAIGHRAKAVYAEHFGIEHTVAMLRNPFLYSPGHSRGLSMPPGIPGAI